MLRHKSPVIAYGLLILAGALGVHRFYLGYRKSGVTLLACTICTFMFLPDLVLAHRYPIPSLLWCGADLVLLPGMVKRIRQRQV